MRWKWTMVTTKIALDNMEAEPHASMGSESESREKVAPNKQRRKQGNREAGQKLWLKTGRQKQGQRRKQVGGKTSKGDLGPGGAREPVAPQH